MAGEETNYITFKPPVPPPPPIIVPQIVGPLPVTDLNWFNSWQPPVTPPPRVERPHFSLVISEDNSFPILPQEYVQRSSSITNIVPFNYLTVQALLQTSVQPPTSSLPIEHVPAEHVCDLTLSQLMDLVAERLDDPFIYYTQLEIKHALNIAQRLFAFLTLCLEKTATFNLTNGQAFYTISDQITDFICPLRVSHVNSSTRLRSDTIHNLDLRNVTWRSSSGNPQRYAQQGFDLLAITPQPSSGLHTLSIVYAGMPAEMTLASSVPEIPTENHIDLIDGAAYILRLKEGGQELVNATDWLQRFLGSATRRAKFIRAKSKAQLYDRQPFDLESFDRGRFAIKLKRQMEMQKKMERDKNG